MSKLKKIIYYFLEFIFLMLSYMLCDYLWDRYNLFVGIVVGLLGYFVVMIILNIIFKKKNIWDV